MFSYFFEEPLKCLLFAVIIFAANVIQTITGFAGVMLALPPSLLLLGPDMAKAAVNLLTWSTSVYLAWNKYPPA